VKVEKRISIASVVVASRNQISADLVGERVILHLDKGFYYGLDEVGSRIWESLQRPKRVGQVLETLLERYNVDREQCQRDLLKLLEELLSENLIEMKKE